MIKGIGHIGIVVKDIEKDIAALKAKGVLMMDQEPRLGLRGNCIAFAMPEALNGVSIELSE